MNPVRCAEFARLYFWLTEDLVDWQSTHSVGSESDSDEPVIVQVHNEACRPLYDGDLDAPGAAGRAGEILLSNVRGKPYKDDMTGQPFRFSTQEISALAQLMMNDTFLPLAPYRPQGQLEMW